MRCELIAGIEEREIAIVLASSASSDEVEHYVEMLGAEDQAAWTTSSDVENTKPEPDLVEAALEKAGTQRRCLGRGHGLGRQGRRTRRHSGYRRPHRRLLRSGIE